LRRYSEAHAALVAELVRHREAAAGSLAFELAARIQEEIEAVEWVVAIQRVTRPGTGSHGVYGWADGVCVFFEVRDGRMERWRVADAPAPPPEAARTPDQWADFAANAAILAARLRRH